MVVPRPWSNIEKQRDPIQTMIFAEPSATDIRFKLAAFFLFGGWLTTVFSLRHSIKHYKPRNRGLANRGLGFVQYTPYKFILTLSLSLTLIAYDALCAFDFSVSPLKIDTNLGFMYGLGWGNIACIMLVYEVAGFLDPNEDKELIRQRRIRGSEIDSEMGITKKPHWWSRLHHDNTVLNVHDQIARNVSEIGGGQATRRNIERTIELGNMPVTRDQDNNRPGKGNLESVRIAASLLFPASGDRVRERIPAYSEVVEDIPPPITRVRTIGRSDSTNSGISGGQPQQIRSMLDV